MLINEDFRGRELHYDFTLLGHAGLTNAPDTSDDAPDGRRGAPPYYEDYKSNPGYLQLTDNNHDKVGGVIYNHPLPTSGGLDVTFEMYQFNSTTNDGTFRPADGIGFFIVDGQYELERAGGYGGSLGYAQKLDNGIVSAGVRGGYLGVGFDSLGNFITGTWECRGGTINNPAGSAWCTPPANDQHPKMVDSADRRQNAITLRGPWKNENEYSGYEYLISTAADVNPGDPNAIPYAPILYGASPTKSLHTQAGLNTWHDWGTSAVQAEQLLKDAKHLVRVTLDTQQCEGETGQICPLVSVYVDFPPTTPGAVRVLDDNDLVLRYKMTTPMPETFKFGFAGSTGAMTDVHLIRTLEVSTLRPEAHPDFLLEKDAIDVPAGRCVPGDEAQHADPVRVPGPTYLAGDEVCYRFKVTNTGDTELTDITITDTQIGFEGTVELLGHPGTELEVAYLYATHTLTQDDVDAAVEGGSGTYTNVAVANATFGDESMQRGDDAVVPVEPTPEEPCAGATCTTDPPVDPCADVASCSPNLPLPAVGGARDSLGTVAFSVAAALVALLAASRRRRRRRPS